MAKRAFQPQSIDQSLGLVDRMPGLKSFFVAEAAGDTGDRPRLLKGEMA